MISECDEVNEHTPRDSGWGVLGGLAVMFVCAVIAGAAVVFAGPIVVRLVEKRASAFWGAARHTQVDAVLQPRLVLRRESSPTQSLARARARRSSVSWFQQTATALEAIPCRSLRFHRCA